MVVTILRKYYSTFILMPLTFVSQEPKRLIQSSASHYLSGLGIILFKLFMSKCRDLIFEVASISDSSVLRIRESVKCPLVL